MLKAVRRVVFFLNPQQLKRVLRTPENLGGYL